MKSIIKITTMLLAGMLLLFAVPAFSQESAANQAAKEAAKAAAAAKAATDEAAKPKNERDCNKIVQEVKKARAAAAAAEAAAINAENAVGKAPKSKKQAAQAAADAAMDSAKAAKADAAKASEAAPGMGVAEDVKKKVDAMPKDDNSKVEKIKQEIKEAADKVGAENPCDPDAVKRALENKLKEIEKEVQKNKEVETWFDRNFPKKDGKRLNISYDGNGMNDLFATATGTGNTTGHIATLSLTNPTGQPITATPGAMYIPSSGQYQPYIVPSVRPVTIAPHTTVQMPLQGWCADVFSKPVPFGETLPPFKNWVAPGSGSMTDFTPTAGSGWIPAQPGGSGLVPTIPGTDLPVGYTIDPKRYPAEAAPFLSSALDAITKAYDRLAQSGEISTPFSGNPEKEREAVIQQTFWMYSSALAGKEYSQEDFRANTIRQYETGTGRSFAKQNNEIRESVEDGVNQFWGTFEAVGVEAKVLSNVQGDPDGQLKEANYDQYAHYRGMGQDHDQAMDHAVGIPEKRKAWSGEFRERYEKGKKGK